MDETITKPRHVAVVGGGNAALCAAIAAREMGAEVTLFERAPFPLRGGNTAFTAGAMRVVYRGSQDIRKLVDDLSDAEADMTDFGEYTEEMFFDDLTRVTESRGDPDLTETLVKSSFSTLQWMRSHGVRFLPIYGRQAFKVGGRFRFWGGLTIETAGGGPGLVNMLTAEAERMGVRIHYDARGLSLISDDEGVEGVVVRIAGKTKEFACGAVVLAAGGFQSNVEWRTRYLGKDWDLAKVRGTRFNTGDGISMGLQAGGSAAGNWSGSHAVQWDANAPEYGDLSVGDGFQKHSYPFGIIVNSLGKRFVDEGADFRNYTYAKYGREVLAQPGQRAWQVFDAQVSHLLRDEYRIRQVSRVRADTLKELASGMEGIDRDVFLQTVKEYNAAVRVDIPFDPNVKDGRCAEELEPPRSNWANQLVKPPFDAYEVTCGITFTFGGLRIDTDARVIDDEGKPVPNLFACGEMAAGIFYFNYPGGSGLTAGSVFGRIAGTNAAG